MTPSTMSIDISIEVGTKLLQNLSKPDMLAFWPMHGAEPDEGILLARHSYHQRVS